MKKNTTGFAPLVLIIIIALVFLVAIASTYFVTKNVSNNKTKTTPDSTTTTQPSSSSSPNSAATDQTTTPTCNSSTLQSLTQTTYPGSYVNQTLCANGYAIGEMNVPQQHLNGWVVYYQAQSGQWVYLKAAQMGDPCSAALMPSGFPVNLCNQWQEQNNNNNNGNNDN